MLRPHALACIALMVGCTANIDQLLGPTSSEEGSSPATGTGAGGADDGAATAGSGNGKVPVDPGHVAMRRLNRSEYNRTVRDLLGTTTTPADNFPADDVSYGFDTIGDVLSISPLHLELYDSAAEKLVAEVFARPAGDAQRDKILKCASSDATACASEVLDALPSAPFDDPSRPTNLRA